MNIRFASKVDIDGIVTIYRELAEYYFGEDAPPRDDIRGYFLNRVFADHSGVQVLLAEDQSRRVIGFSTISILYPAPKLTGQLYMKDLFTASAARGRGVGRRLMQFIATYAREKGCNRVDWTAERSNPGAGAFYAAIGAERVDEKQYFRFEGDALSRFALAVL
ncbi:MAG: GNAT family N-acetyltransferase [Pseudomonadota bacterium]